MTLSPATGWEKVVVTVPDEALKEAIVGEFSEDGLSGVWERPLGAGLLELVLYFSDSRPPPGLRSRLNRLFENSGYPEPRMETAHEAPADWTREWRKGFRSFDVGERFRVVPSWEEASAREGRLVIEMDPGLAFGTGTHETTQMMLEALESLVHGDLRILDLGTGSGILTIAARRLGFQAVTACDVDPDAVAVAARNMRRNRTHSPLFVGSLDALASSGFDLILANLTLDVIVSALGEIKRVLAAGGSGVLSGVLATEKRKLSRVLASSGFRKLREVERGEWMAVFVVADGSSIHGG